MSTDFEINKISEREIWVGESSYCIGDDSILYVTSVGEIDDKMAFAEEKIALEFLCAVEGKLNVLVDLNNAGKPSSEARKVLKALNESEKIGKIALWGIHPVARMLVSMVIGSSKNKDIHFF